MGPKLVQSSGPTAELSLLNLNLHSERPSAELLKPEAHGRIKSDTNTEVATGDDMEVDTGSNPNTSEHCPGFASASFLSFGV